MKGYGELFKCHKRDNISRCGEFISGLLHQCKSNIERMVEIIPKSNYGQLHHFISKSPWDAKAVMDRVAEKVFNTLSTPTSNTPKSLGLILDESGWEKSGKKSVGVSRQYIGQVGKVSNGQVGVFASLTDSEQVGLVQGRLYLPQEWVSDSKRCDKAGIPKKEQVYQTKPQLAIEIIKTLPEQIIYDWVGGDDLYGNSPELRQYLYEANQAFTLDVSDSLGVYLSEPKLYIPSKKQGRGRTPSSYACDDKPIQLSQLIKQIPPKDWQTITHRNGTKGPLTRKACIMDVFVWKAYRDTDIEAVQLIISTELDGSEIKYSLSFHPVNKISLDTALYQQMQRYWVERAFQNVKEQLGLHKYQVRSWRAWHHHIALTLMTLHFMLEVQKEQQQEMPLISIPDIKLIFAKKLLNKLNSDKGLLDALNLRHKQRKDDIDRQYKKFSKVPK